MTHLEDGVRAFDEISGDRHQTEAPGCHVRGDLPRGAPAMSWRDGALSFLRRSAEKHPTTMR